MAQVAIRAPARKAIGRRVRFMRTIQRPPHLPVRVYRVCRLELGSLT
jgi:hypothetical protein